MLSLVDEAIESYAISHTMAVPPIYAELRAETLAKTEYPQMQVGDLEGRILYMLARLVGARRAVEVGTFTGCSSMHIAEALPDDGVLITCDIDPESTAIARRYWARVPWGGRIQLRLGPALETLESLDPTSDPPFDLAFIDADKAGYIGYWEALVPRMWPGGVIVADNVLWSGRVLDPSDPSDHALVAFNRHVLADERVEQVMLPIRDGITVARVR